MLGVERPARRASLRDCATLAGDIRRTERGRAILRLLRPRGVSWVLRDRMPLTLQLLLADREHRLVRLGPSTFAVADYPLAVQDQVPRPDRTARWLRRLELYWSAAVLALPAAGLMGVAAAVAVLGRGDARAAVAAVVLVLLALLWVFAVLTAGILAAAVRAWHNVERTADPRVHAAGPLLSAHWAVPLLHAPDPAQAGPLVAAARSRVAELAHRLPESAGRDGGGTEIVLCFLDGITSEVAEQRVRSLPDAVPLPGTRPRLLCLGDAKAMLPSRKPSYPARGIFLILGASMLAVLVTAALATERERLTCRSGCPGGLTDYTDALLYLVGRLVPFAGDTGPAPAGADVRLLGLLVSVLGLTLVACVVVAIGRHIRFQLHGVDRAYDAIRAALEARRPTFGIVTAIPEEYAAVRAALDDPTEYTVPRDRSHYLLGSLPSAGAGPAHSVVATLMLDAGNDLAAAASTNLARSFHTVNCVVMSGIAAGVPQPDRPAQHVRLGDVVVATWGIVDFDHVDQRPDGVFLRNGMPQPSTLLQGSAKLLQAGELSGHRPWETELDRIVSALPSYRRPDDDTDVLFRPGSPPVPVPHPDRRLSGHRPDRPKIHHGLIGSSDRSLRDARVRDALAARYGLLALEMEGKGIGTANALAGIEWLVVRGISDYGDEFTTATWRCYAAAAAAAYMRALLAETPSLGPRGGHVRGAD